MIVDVFPFFNEFEILDIRLNLISNKIDKFVIVEHDIDFNNNPKNYNLESQIKNLNEKYNNKIIYVKISSKPLLDHKWSQEIHQKNNLACAIDMFPDAYFLFGDLDEVPNPDKIDDLVESYHNFGPSILLLYWCINKWDIVLKQRWPGPVLGKRDDILNAGGARKFMCPRGSKSMHWKNPSYPELFPAGWHWSFFGDPKNVVKKLDSVLEGNKIRRKMYGNEESVIKDGRLLTFLGKYCGEAYDQCPVDLYPENIRKILQQYPDWWS